MTTSIQTDHIQKIRSLLWSNTPVNDLLALEIIRSQQLIETLESDLVVAMKTTTNKLVREQFKDYLKEQLSYTRYFLIVDSEFNAAHIRHYDDFVDVLDVYQLLYSLIKRTGKGIQDFLKYDNKGTSGYRSELFELFKQNIKNNITKGRFNHSLHLNHLLPEELEEILSDEIIAANPWNEIIIRDTPLRKLPKQLFNIPSLRRLYITDTILTEIPEGLFQLTNLQVLKLGELNCKHLPSDWSNFKELTHLNFGSSKLHFTSLSFINTLPKLKELNIGSSTLSTPHLLLNKKALPISYWSEYSTLSQLPFASFLKYASAIKRSALSEADQHYFFDLVLPYKRFSELPKLKFEYLLKAVNINYAPFREVYLQQLETVLANNDGIDNLKAGATLYVTGKPNLKKNDIRKKLKALSINYVTTFSSEVTHLLIGKNPKVPIIENHHELAFITENQFQTFLSQNQPQYFEQSIQENSENIQDNLRDLLISPEPANALIAIEMMHSGGVPSTLLETLLVVQKTNSESKVRAAAKKLLELYAPPEWLPIIRDKQTFSVHDKTVREQVFNNKLKRIAKKTSIDLAAMLSLALFKVYRRGLRYIFFRFRKAHKWRIKAFMATMTDTHFDYAAGLGYTNLKERFTEFIPLYKMSGLPPFPIDILEMTDQIESIDFHNCKFEKIHISINKFSNLKHLDYSFNQIKKLPKNIKKNQSLESLNLSQNMFKEFPLEVLALKNLKKLDLRRMRNYPDGNFLTLTIPDIVKEQLPHCEILV